MKISKQTLALAKNMIAVIRATAMDGLKDYSDGQIWWAICQESSREPFTVFAVMYAREKSNLAIPEHRDWRLMNEEAPDAETASK